MRYLLTPVLLIISLQSFALERVNLDQLESRNGVHFVLNSSAPFTGYGVSYFENGQMQFQVRFRAGLRHGKETAWHENGELKHIVRYKNGQLQSRGSSWYSNKTSKSAKEDFVFCDGREDLKAICGKPVQKASHIEICGEKDC